MTRTNFMTESVLQVYWIEAGMVAGLLCGSMVLSQGHFDASTVSFYSDSELVCVALLYDRSNTWLMIGHKRHW